VFEKYNLNVFVVVHR